MKTQNSKTQKNPLVHFPFLFTFLHFLVKQKEFNRERERRYLEGLDWRREETFLKQCLRRILAANIGVNQKIYVFPCLCSLACPFIPWVPLRTQMGGFQGFRFGVREKGFSLKLVANLVLLPKRQVFQLRESNDHFIFYFLWLARLSKFITSSRMI